jgi:hypothetical protein
MSAPDFATAADIHGARPDVPIQTIRRHMRVGAPWFPGARTVGRTLVVPLNEAEAYVEKYARYARQNEAGADAHPSGTSAPVPPPPCKV